MTASKERFTREFIEWNEVTGALEPDTGWYYEALSIVEDADKEIERLRGLLHEVANSGISYDASKYLEVQIDADTWKGLAEFRGTVETFGDDEETAHCGDCGAPLEHVRPGKWQHIGLCPRKETTRRDYQFMPGTDADGLTCPVCGKRSCHCGPGDIPL